MSVSLLNRGALIFGSAEPRVFSDFANGNFIGIEFSNPDSSYEIGRGGSIVTCNTNSEQATLTVRLLRGSPDDVFLTGVRADYRRSPETFVLMTGNASIKIGSGGGEVTTENYTLSEGSFANPPTFTTDTAGDIETAVVVWTFNVKANRNFS